MTYTHTRQFVATFGAATLMLAGSACATKKHVRNAVGPVEARVSQAERKNNEQQAALGELGNSVSRADERAQDADRKATAAGESATRAGESATRAGEAAQVAKNRADQGYTLADSTRARLGEVSENIDNYKMVTSENILFGVGKSALLADAKQQLDAAVTQLKDTQNYILEVQGFADSTGSSAKNLELSKRRADAVVRYLTVQHKVPLRKINTLGIGEEDPDANNKTREGRKMARRVEMRVFSRDLGGKQSANAGGTTPPAAAAITPAPQQ